jgi:propanol-preferring alcohol dehydrogenase
MVLKGPRPVEEEPLVMAEADEPVPGSGQVRIRVSACGICRTDLHIVEGELPSKKLPVIPGHQIVGTVDKLGRQVIRFRQGDRVGVAWLNWTCGKCEFCRKGLENLCEKARFTGYDVDGGYAEYAAVHEDFAYRIPEGLPDVEAAPLLCAGIIGFRALRLSNVQKGERLGLYGFGASAHIVIQIARHWGCQVFVFTRGEEHRNMARKLGADWTGRAEDTPPAKLHSAIIFAPAGRLVLSALRVLEKGGTLALAGIYMTPIPQMDYREHLYYEKTVRSVANSTRKDAEDLLRLAGEIPIHTHVETFTLGEANRALPYDCSNKGRYRAREC